MLLQQIQKAPRLKVIKALHTLVWAFFVSCIVALPVLALQRHFQWVLALTAVVLSETVVLALNRGQCPMTGWAAKFTDDKRHNFDIFLPEWLARYNKAIFGTLFVVNELIVVWPWVQRP